MSLEIYDAAGFKFFKCRNDKAPAVEKGQDWRSEEVRLPLERAEELQEIGTMIGAWVPDDVIVIDLDRHPGKPDGLEEFKRLKANLGINYNMMEDTFVVRTGGGGYHVFFYVGPGHGIRQGAIKLDGREIGIDIKTHSGYVIAAGSPGYMALNNNEPGELPDQLYEWIKDVRAVKKNANNGDNYENTSIDTSLLNESLSQLKQADFRTNDSWLELIMSAIATFGDSAAIKNELVKWSLDDPHYADDDSVEKRIASIKKDGGIRKGTFVKILRQNKVDPELIALIKSERKKIDKIEKDNKKRQKDKKREEEVSNILNDAEDVVGTNTFEIPIKIDYRAAGETSEARELLITSSHTQAARVLYNAIGENCLYSIGEKQLYLYIGPYWKPIYDKYSIVYIVLTRIILQLWGTLTFDDEETREEYQKYLVRVMRSIGDEGWKRKVLMEYESIISIPSVDWDSPKCRETLTCSDGVIYFSDKKITTGSGEPTDYRLDFIDLTMDEILNAADPVKYNEFIESIFPDPETRATAEELLSLSISGDASRRIFQVWNGEGANGKGTLITILEAVLGNKVVTFPPGLLLASRPGQAPSITPELARFKGKYVAISQETEAGAKFSTGVIKNYTGDDRIIANPKYKDPIEFDATWQLILVTNDLPHFDSDDTAFMDRLVVLPFVVTFVSSDEAYAKKRLAGYAADHIKPAKNKHKMMAEIKKERSGILKKLILDYINIEDKGVTVSQLSNEWKTEYHRSNDSIGAFVSAVCELQPDAFTTSEELAQAYRDFSGTPKVSTTWVVRKVLKTNVSLKKGTKMVDVEEHQYGFEQSVKKQRRGIVGIRILSPAEQAENNANKEKVEEIIDYYNGKVTEEAPF